MGSHFVPGAQWAILKTGYPEALSQISISDLPTWSSLSPQLGAPICRAVGPRPRRAHKFQAHGGRKVTLAEAGE